jgi:hypothetical protein
MSPNTVQSVAFSNDSLRRRTNIRSWITEHTFQINVVSLMLVALIVVGYIVQVNATISKGYVIRDLETQVNELSLLNEKLELETRRSQSLNHVSHAVKMLGFVDAQSPEYIDVAGSSYALAE